MKQIALDSSLKKLSTDTLTVQIGLVESPRASFFVCIKFLWRKFRWGGFIMVLSTIALQAPSIG